MRLLWLTPLCFLIASLSPALAQERPGIHVDLSFDAISYMGDLVEGGEGMFRLHPGANFSVTTAQNHPLRVQFNIGIGTFAEQFDGELPTELAQVDIATYVATRFVYGDLRLQWRPLPDARVSPFLALGAGLVHFRPEDAQGRVLTRRSNTRDVWETRYNAFIPQLPLHVGAQIRVNERVRMGLSYTYRFVPTDYLDNMGSFGDRQGFDALQAISLTMGIHIGGEQEKPAQPPTESHPQPSLPQMVDAEPEE